MNMNGPHAFAASLLESTLSAQAAGVALCLRERLGATLAAELGRFEDLSGDARVRLRYLCEAVALECPGIYLEFLDWQRATHAARELAPELLQGALACQRRVLAEGLPPAALATLEPYLAAGEGRLAQPLPTEVLADAGPHGAAVEPLVAAALAGRHGEALALARAACSALGEETFVESVLVAVLREFGRLWQCGAIHVGREHLGTRIVEDVLAEIARVGACAPALGWRVLIAAPSGDLHEIGGRMVARRFAQRGWEVLFLGANVPREDLVRSVDELEPDLLVLSVSQGLHVRAAAEVVRQLRAARPAPVVLVGGAPFRSSPELWRRVGADGMAASASEAEREARRLVAARRP